MCNFGKKCFCYSLLVSLTLLDFGLKVSLGFLIAFILWLPFAYTLDAPRWILTFGCATLGMFFLGLWDCCDMFGLNRFAEWAHGLIDSRS
jgi:hypothetical protein